MTHETIKQHTTEIVKKSITRDIHEHEYRTLLLPVKEVEVLPTRHYFQHPDGRLQEIEAPEGFKEGPYECNSNHAHHTHVKR